MLLAGLLGGPRECPRLVDLVALAEGGPPWDQSDEILSEILATGSVLMIFFGCSLLLSSFSLNWLHF